MARDLDAFLGEVRAESKAAGPGAVAELEAYLRHFDLSRQVFELRKAHGWSQLELARQSGVQQSEISRIEHGRGNPTFQTISAIAGAMQMQVTFVPARVARPGRAPRAVTSGMRGADKQRRANLGRAKTSAKALGRARA